LYRPHFDGRPFRIVCIVACGRSRDTHDTKATPVTPIDRCGDIAAIPGGGNVPLQQPAIRHRPISECTAMLPRILTITVIVLAAALASTAAIAVAPERNAQVQKPGLVGQRSAASAVR